MAYPVNYWAEFVRSSSATALVEDATGDHVWLRTSDGLPLEQQSSSSRTGGWADVADDTGEPDYLGTWVRNRDVTPPYFRFRKAGEAWIPNDFGLGLTGGATYRFFGVPPGSRTHTFTVRTGSSGSLSGYWDGNAGSITGAVYRLPNGVDATIRQVLVGSNIGIGEVRFLLNQAGLGVGDTDQFPDRITATRGEYFSEWVPADPEMIGAFGQGIGRDYTLVTGSSTVTNTFSPNQDTELTLHYDSVTHVIRPSFSGTVSGVLTTAPEHIEVPEAFTLRPSFSGTVSGVLSIAPRRLIPDTFVIRPSFSGQVSGVLTATPEHIEVPEFLTLRPSFAGAVSGDLTAVPEHMEVPETLTLRPAFAGQIAGVLDAVPNHIEVPESHIIRPVFRGDVRGILTAVPERIGLFGAEAHFAFSPLIWSFTPVLVPTYVAATDPDEPTMTESVAVIENTGAWAPPIQWSRPYRETYKFRTSIIVSEGGQEQRIAQRSHPRIDYDFVGYLDPDNFRRISLLMAHRTSELIVVPHPRQSALVAEAVESGGSQVTLNAIPPWLNPGASFFLVNHLTNELVVAESITDQTVSLSVPVAGSYEPGHRVLRAAPGRPISGPAMQALTSRAGTLPIRIAGDPVENWHYGYPEAFPHVLNEREYFDISPNWASPVEVAIIPTWLDVDTGRGAVTRIDDTAFPIQRRRFRYLMHTEERVERILGLFYRARGRQKGFYLPSFTHDLSPVGVARRGATQFETAGVGAAEVFHESAVFRRLRFLDREGFYIREVDSVAALPNGNTAVTLTESFPRDMMPDELFMASWVNLVRFETDELTVDWHTGSVAETTVTVRTLEDPA